MRRHISDLVLKCPAGNELEQLFQNDIRANYRVLLQQLAVETPSSKQEILLCTSLRKKMRRAGAASFDAGLLMASMLYNRAYNLPFIPSINRIPGFFMGDFLHYMTNPALMFSENGEEVRYVSYMNKWVSYLHENIITSRNSRFWKQVAEFFIANSDFGPLYFSDKNLVKLYTMRGDIIERYLLMNGHDTDHHFKAVAGREEKQIRVGILANHYMPHPETFAALPLYEHLDQNFRVTLYSFSSSESETRDYCRSRAHEFRVLPRQLELQVKTIRDDNLDILFIASNITSKVNPICLLTAHRLARQQIAGVGSVTTTGLRNIDYYLTGKLTDTPENSAQYRETLVWLSGPAHCFTFCDAAAYSEKTVTRRELGIEEDAIVYMSGANMFKILPELVTSWAKILENVPGSILMLYPYGPNWSENYPKRDFTNRIKGILRKYGVASSRLVILDPQPVPDHNQIKEYVKLGDVYLDSFPFSGTTSFMEPLGLGKPVITSQGKTFRTSMGAALLKSIDMYDLVASSPAHYIQLASALGKDQPLRKQQGNKISAKMKENPPFLNSMLYASEVANICRQLIG